MSVDDFLHGVETDQVPAPIAPVSPNNMGVLGAVITADGADDTVFPLNQPVLVTNQQILASLTTNISQTPASRRPARGSAPGRRRWPTSSARAAASPSSCASPTARTSPP